jgi:hypothetical protein
VITFVLVTLGQAQAQENRGSAKYMLPFCQDSRLLPNETWRCGGAFSKRNNLPQECALASWSALQRRCDIRQRSGPSVCWEGAHELRYRTRREGKREVVPRPHALAVSPHLFAGKAIIAPPAIPRRDTQIATEKWQKTGRPLFQGGGLPS